MSKDREPKLYTVKGKEAANKKAAIREHLEAGHMARSERPKGEMAGRIFDLQEHTHGVVKIVSRLNSQQIENLTDEQKENISDQIREVLKSGTEILEKTDPRT